MSDAEQTIPKARFDQRVQQARDAETALREQIAQLTDANKQLTRQAGKAEGLAQQVTDLTGKLEAAGLQHTRQMAATRAGLTDPDDAADVLAIYNRRAPEGVSFEDWLSKADALPRSVVAMLPQAAPEPGPDPQPQNGQDQNGQTQAPRTLPRSNQGVVQGRTTGQRQSPADIHQAMMADPAAAAQQRVRLGLPETNPHAYRLHLGRRRG